MTLAHSVDLWLAPTAAILGLIVGSFLNVVIVRLPVMMENAWADACAEISATPPPTRARYNLAWPRSHCTACGHTLTWYELIPLVSWLCLRGRCAHCKAPVSWQYPLTEVFTAALFAACALRFGLSLTTIAAMGLCAALTALAVIDARTMLLPDAITQPLLWAGLLIALASLGFTRLDDAVIGAAAGYASLWLVATGFRLVTGKEGMGQGDWKLLAALGAWFGWQSLPAIVLLASIGGVIIGVVQIIRKRAGRGQPMPFGPYLAVAGLATLFWSGQAWPGLA